MMSKTIKRCPCCRFAICCCKEELSTWERDVAILAGTEKCSDADIRDLAEREEFYRVTPYDWKVTGRGGTSYSIERVRRMASARTKEDADEIVGTLNRAKKLARDNLSLRNRVEALQSQILYEHEKAGNSVSKQVVEHVLVQAEREAAPGWGRFGNAHVKQFVKSVRRMLGIE